MRTEQFEQQNNNERAFASASFVTAELSEIREIGLRSGSAAAGLPKLELVNPNRGFNPLAGQFRVNCPDGTVILKSDRPSGDECGDLK